MNKSKKYKINKYNRQVQLNEKKKKKNYITITNIKTESNQTM